MGKKRRNRRIRRRVFEYLIAVLMIAVSAFIIYSALFPPSNVPMVQGDVAIIDQLSIESPNQNFLDSVTQTFASVGLKIDVYEGKEITVELYRSLPSLGYEIIVFRAHSAYPMENPELIPIENPRWPVYIFTAEPYDESKYVFEQLMGQVAPAKVTEDSASYFSIGPEFVRKSMNGRFPNWLIIISSCGGLYSSDLAEAFIEKGAKGIISWDDLVDLGHTDTAIDYLIRSSVIDGLVIKDAIKKTMQEVGPDPYYKSVLLFYPEEIGEKNIDDQVLILDRHWDYRVH